MPIAPTRFLGPIDYSPEQVIDVPLGIPPFPDTRFLALATEEKRPLIFLQSLQNAELCFVTVPADVLAPGYRPSLHPEDLERLEWPADRPPAAPDLTCLLILTVPESGDITANLFAPVWINAARSLAVQAVRADGAYSPAEPLASLQGGAGC